MINKVIGVEKEQLDKFDANLDKKKILEANEDISDSDEGLVEAKQSDTTTDLGTSKICSAEEDNNKKFDHDEP